MTNKVYRADGGDITFDGEYRVHTFTSNETFSTNIYKYFSQQHLKSKYGNNIDIELYIGDIDPKKTLEAVGTSLPVLNFQKKSQTSLKYTAPSSTSLSLLFTEIEKLKKIGLIKNFTLNQANLEQIFMRLTR